MKIKWVLSFTSPSPILRQRQNIKPLLLPQSAHRATTHLLVAPSWCVQSAESHKLKELGQIKKSFSTFAVTMPILSSQRLRCRKRGPLGHSY